MSIVSRSKRILTQNKAVHEVSQDVNLENFKAELTEKLDTLKPVLIFHEEVLRGWKNRKVMAKNALLLIKRKTEGDKNTLKKLLEVSSEHVVFQEKIVAEMRNIVELLEQKIRDLNLLAIRRPDQSNLSLISATEMKEIQDALFRAQGLLEVRDSNPKALTI